jgi:hypothetical protein
MHEFLAGFSSGLAPLMVMLLAIFAGIFLNQRGLDKLEKAMSDRFSRIESQMDITNAELRYFHGVTGELKARVETLEKR